MAVMDIITQRIEANGKPRYLSPSAVVDGAGNIFLGVAQTKGVGTQFTRNTLILKVTPAGAVSVVDERPMPEGGLVDGVGIVQSGSVLHVFAGYHVGDPKAVLGHYTLPVCVPYPNGPQVGMAGAYEPNVEVPDVGATREEVQAIVNALAASLPNMVRQAVRDVLAEEKVLTEGNVYTSPALYKRISETAYESCRNAIKDS
jgi:hypothetical protein